MTSNPETDIPDDTWGGYPARCDCGAENAAYVKDVDHDGGTCEVFRCRACGSLFHVEMPD
jgi:hypothetical protein